MSSVKSIQPNFQPQSKVKKTSAQNSPNFKGVPPTEDELVTQVVSQLNKNLKEKGLVSRFIGWASAKLNKNDGEMQNQIINAAFTTTLAPLMIAYNPISTQDKKTKQYTALRQPVSAGIAITGGYAMTVAVDRYMNKMYSEGYIKTLDGRFAPNKGYLKTLFKKQTAETDLEKFVKTQQNQSKEIFTQLMSLNPDEHEFQVVTELGENGKKPNNIIVITEKATGKEVYRAQKAIPKLETTADVQKFVDTKNVHKRTFGDFLSEHFGFEFHPQSAEEIATNAKPKVKLALAEEKIKNVNAMDFLTQIGLLGEKTKGANGAISYNDLCSMLSVIRTDAIPESELAATGHTAEQGRKIVSVTAKHASRAIENREGEAVKSKMSLQQLLDRLYMINNDVDAAGNKLELSPAELKVRRQEEIQNLMNKNVSEIVEEISAKFKKSNINKTFNPKTKVADTVTNMVDHIANMNGKKFPNFNKYASIFFNLFMVAITCTALNWAYPRFVETFFPNLAKNDKEPSPQAKKGGN